MSLQNKGNWTYEYTDENDNRFYRLYDETNKQLSVINLRRYTDDLMDMDHINWEMWKTPSFCESEEHAETLLEYYDSGIFGSGFLSCLTDAAGFGRTGKEWSASWANHKPYKLSKDPEFA
jgi:hypothetical protein